MSSRYKSISDDILQGRVKDALKKMETLLPELSEYNKRVVNSFQKVYNVYNEQFNRGLISFDEKQYTVSDIGIRILGFINKLESRKKKLEENTNIRDIIEQKLISETTSAERPSVYISYSSKDYDFVLRLAKDLVENNVNCWLDQWEIKVGDSIPEKIEQGLGNAKLLAVVISLNSLKSKWVEKEWKTKYWDEVNEGKVMVLPVLIEECIIPKLLQTKKYADFRSIYVQGLNDLISAIGLLSDASFYIGAEDYSSPDYWVERGVEYYNQGQIDLSLHLFNRAINLEPTHYRANYNLGLAYTRLGRLDEAIVRMAKASNTDADSRRLLTKLLIETKEFTESLRYMESFQGTEGDEDFHYDMGLIFMGLKDYERAISEFKRAPNISSSWHNMGNVFARMLNEEKANEAFEKSISINPSQTQAYNGKGNSFIRRGMLLEAIEQFEFAIEVDSDDPISYSNLAVALYQNFRIQDSINALDIALSLKPDYEEAWFNKGVAHEAINEKMKAYNAYQIAIRLGSKNKRASFFCAKYEEEFGDR